MLQILSIALRQVKVGNTSESLLIEIRQIIYYLHQTKKISEKVYNNIMNSVKGIIQKWILYLWILGIVKHQILTSSFSILQIK